MVLWRLSWSMLFLLACGTACAQDVRLTGVVKDGRGGVVAGAQVTLENAQRVPLGSTHTDDQGRFVLQRMPPGNYLLVVAARGFAERRVRLEVGRESANDIEVTLGFNPIHTEVTVTAHPGRVEDAETVTQPVNVIPAEAIRERSRAVVAQVALEEVGAHVQRTSPTVAGIYVRGLTGNKVNIFVDGVRYSTAAQRGGINTFLGLIDASTLEAVEILRGPNSAQYGSDAIGGSVQFVSRVPAFSAGAPQVRGTFGTFFDTADTSFGSNLSTSYAARSFGLLTTVSGRRTNTLRPGSGVDSHSAFTRFFGLPSDRFQSHRLPDTAFTQYGGLLRFNWSPGIGSQLMAHYSRSQQDGGKRYDQLLGGDGNLVADLRNLMLDFFYLRYDKQRWGWLDDLTAAYSFNSQREERVNQGGNGDPEASVNHEYERTRAHGLHIQAGKQSRKRQTLLFGAEYYRERIRSPSFAFDPLTLVSAPRRPRVPDRARYQSGGAYIQDVVDAIPKRLRLVGDLRYSAASYRVRAADSPIVGGAPLWPDDSLRASSVTFRVGAVLTPVDAFHLFANVSRGFRTPHMTDLGTLGLTGSGFEVAAPDVAGLGATIGSTATSEAVSTGISVTQVKPETSLSYEVGARYRHPRFQTDFSFFVNDIGDLVAKQALILPPGAVGQQLGGQPIIAQNPNGVVFVAVANNPVLVRANFGDARIYGIEHTSNWRVAADWSLKTIFTYLHARDKRTSLPPNIEGGTPAPDGYLKVRYAPAGGRVWIELYIHAAARQSRVSSLDLEDRRTGATRSRSSISSFFLHGATARGLVSTGPDGALGNADDVLLATGETLGQILDRVLGGLSFAPLFTAVRGYITFNLRGGFRVGERHEVLLDFANIGDRNYRGVSWGMDAAGRSLAVRYLTRF